jgi:hypothetical protein
MTQSVESYGLGIDTVLELHDKKTGELLIKMKAEEINGKSVTTILYVKEGCEWRLHNTE